MSIRTLILRLYNWLLYRKLRKRCPTFADITGRTIASHTNNIVANVTKNSAMLRENTKYPFHEYSAKVSESGVTWENKQGDRISSVDAERDNDLPIRTRR